MPITLSLWLCQTGSAQNMSLLSPSRAQLRQRVIRSDLQLVEIVNESGHQCSGTLIALPGFWNIGMKRVNRTTRMSCEILVLLLLAACGPEPVSRPLQQTLDNKGPFQNSLFLFQVSKMSLLSSSSGSFLQLTHRVGKKGPKKR